MPSRMARFDFIEKPFRGSAVAARTRSDAFNPVMMRTVALFIFGTLLARLFDLNGEVNRARKKHNRAIIAADVRRFGHVIKDGVLSTHRGYAAPDVINFAQLSPCDGFIFLSPKQ